MNLAIDIGNSSTKLVIFDQDAIVYQNTYLKLSIDTIKDLSIAYTFNQVILSSVASDNELMEKYLSTNFYFIKLTDKTKLPIINTYKTPKTLGKDRLAAVVGAFYLYPDVPLLVIDAGTCITYDILDSERKYLGGNISPGMEMRLKAMHSFTAKLPLIKKQRLEGLVGYNTETAIRNGAQLGTILEIQGFIHTYFKHFSRLIVTMTGGDAKYLASQIESKIFVHPDLVLIGLNKILQYNATMLE